MEHYQRKNVDILKGTLRTAEEANQIAIDTNVELHGQGQKMDGLDKKLGTVNNQLDQCEETAKEINSYWYYLKNKIKRGLGIKKEPTKAVEDQPKKEEF